MKMPICSHCRSLTASLALLAISSLPLQAAPSRARIDPQAMELLQRMSDTLAGAKALTYTATGVQEVPANTGQFVTFFPTTKVALRRPDKLRAKVGGEVPAFDFFYNGRTAIAFAPETRLYSEDKAPPTIDAMLSGLETETGIRLASAPLLFSNPYRVLSKGVTSAIVVGPVTVRGIACVHLAFQSPGVNWELWIATGARALPLRLAATWTDRPRFPRTLVDFSRWNLNPWLPASGFEFRPPSGSKVIPFEAIRKTSLR